MNLTPRTLALAALLLGGTGCDDDGAALAIDRTRIASGPSRPVKVGATSAERFGPEGAAHGHAGPAARPERRLVCETPAGWTAKPDPSGLRAASFALPGGSDADCGVTLLQGGAGGVAANVDRWRQQLGLAPLPPGGLGALPRTTLLGRPAVLVELEGSYSGAGGAPRAGYRLLGAVGAVDGDRALVFVKLVGPAAVVAAERPRFLALCASVAFASESPHGDPHGSSDEPEPALPALAFDAPASWTAAAVRGSLRLAAFRGGSWECTVTILPGDGGGLEPNLNRWRQQMGQPPLDAAGLAALARVKVLGKDAPLLEVAGAFTSMDGERRDGQMLLGVAGPAGDATVFVKLVGPEAEVRAERGRVGAFVGCIR